MSARIVAELSCNHAGSLERALALVEACKAAGADAVKLQTWDPGKMVLGPHILREGPWVGMDLQELYQRAHTPWAWHQEIYNLAHALKLECFSSVFDEPSLEMLERLGCPRYKIASFELVDLRLIAAVAKRGRPMILSTGMAEKSEIIAAIETARSNGCPDVTVLKCTSAYPADGSSANLATMRSYAVDWGVKMGLSDHTRGIGVALVAVAWGATMIEKHVTLPGEGTLDSAFSIEPRELAQLVTEAKQVARCVGTPGVYGASVHERPQLALRRSLYFAARLPAGATIEAQHIQTARPAKGLHPRYTWRVVGSTTLSEVVAGEPVTWENVRAAPLIA